MTWLHDLVEAGHLHPRRRPPGEEHSIPRSGTFYRHPLYKDSHATLDGIDALCGRPLDLDHECWVDSGWEEAVGPMYLIPDQRKQGRCSACRGGLTTVPIPSAPTPFTDQTDRRQAASISAVQRMRDASLVQVLLRAFPGSEVMGVQ